MKKKMTSSKIPVIGLALCLAAPSLQAQVALNETAAVDTARSMETVVITGQFSPQSLKQSVYKVRTITAETIRLRGATDITGVLNNEAGIRFSTDYTLGETDISLMGMSGQNVKVLLDGIPLADRGSTRQSLSQVDINTIERIEIVEGPMSVVYGTDALAGVINIITKKGNRNGKSFSVTARAQEESAGHYYSPFINEGVHNEHLTLAGQRGRFSASGSFSRNIYGGLTDTAVFPVKVWKPKDQYLAGATLGYHSGKFSTGYRGDYLGEDIFAAGRINTNNYKGIDQHFKTDRFTHQLQTQWQASDGVKIDNAISYQDYKRKTETYVTDYSKRTRTPTDASAPGNEGQWDVSTFTTFYTRTTAGIFLSSKASLQPGFEIKRDHTSGQRISGEPTITDYSAFISAELKPAAWINLRPGLRFSKNSVYDAPPVIPSLNVKIAAGAKTDIRLAYGRGFRAPVLRELYFFFVDGNHNIQGNPDLKAETSNSFTASVTRQWLSSEDVKFSSSVSPFYNRFKNRISLATLPGSTTSTYFNVAEYRTAGGTVENNLQYKNLSVSAAFAYIGRYNLLADDKSLSQNDLPQFTWSPEVSSNVIYRLPGLGASAALFYKFTGRLPSYQIDATGSKVVRTRIASYHWADLTLTKQLFHYFSLQAGIKNLFNVSRLANTSADTGGAHSSGGPVLMAYGRSYFAGLLFQWNK